jgi:putative transcriptional regulator
MNLLIARINYGLTQEELAKKIGSHKSVISRYESGKMTPRPLMQQRIANALAVSREKIFPRGLEKTTNS